jgi:eukaryotic-like serine/threonine-protein kinase
MRTGERVSHFEVLSPLGRGGMGEVWRARDTKLRRDVALKTLPPELAADADRLSRLEREATLLAALNHPRIGAIYGIEENEAGRFLVLELVEGDTLADRLVRGPLPIETALKVALQIAEALEAAHDKGVIHRDLKPANIKLGADDSVKVLDFGLAKDLAVRGDDATATPLRTEIGAVMGTPAYMSPEQARGEVTGRQTDIWSFGVILFEMLAGSPPFVADSTAETLARVLLARPDYGVLPPATPPRALYLLRRCLQNDRKQRLQHIGDARLEIEDALAVEQPAAVPRPAPARTFWVVGAVGILLIAAGAWTVRALMERSSSAPIPAVVHMAIPRLDAPEWQPYGTRNVAISADGSTIAYSARDGLWIRRLDQPIAVHVQEEAQDPFFSPNGEWIGFYGTTSLRKVGSGGGPSEPVVPNLTERPTGAVWNDDGTIVFGTSVGLYRVPDSGGEAELLVAPNRERNERILAWPERIPNSDSLLVTVFTAGPDEVAHIAAFDLGKRTLQYVLSGGTAARYSPTGHLVFASGGALSAVAFDPVSGATRGSATALPNTQVSTGADNGAADFAFSTTGTLVRVAPQAPRGSSLVWVDRHGNQESLGLPLGDYLYARVSPDGASVAVDVQGSNRDIWIWDLRRRAFTRLTDDPAEDAMPLWSTDGRRIFFASNRSGAFDILSTAADGASAPRLELGGRKFVAPNSFAPDGNRLVVYEDFRDLDVLDLKTGDLRPLLPGVAGLGQVSPDGHWLAYESRESPEHAEIFLRPFPDVTSRREKVSIAGGRSPYWSAPGSGELYYLDLEGHMMAAAIELSPHLRLGAVTKLFDWEKPPPGPTARLYDVSLVDGRFLMVKRGAAPVDKPTDLSVTLNWFAELRRLAPLQ